MRVFAIFILLAVAAAGCLNQTAPPTDSTAGTPVTSTPPASTPPASTPQGIAVGEPDPNGGHPGGAMAIRPAHEENATSGYRLVGDESASLMVVGGKDTFSFVATNEGDNATRLMDPCGAGNPTIVLRDENGTVLDPVGPHMRCMAMMGYVAMAPGETVSANLTWDGVWYDAQGTAHNATAGSYTATGTFYATRDGANVEVVVVLPFSVTENRGEL